MSDVQHAEVGTEFQLTDKDFTKVQQLIKQLAGIDLGEGKRALVYGRLVRRLRTLNLRKFGEYLHLVEADSDGEAAVFINALTTNVTSFYREPHHFQYLTAWLPKLVAARRAQRRLRFWSAGCSTGEEPYTLAMTLLEAQAMGILDPTWDTKILATDLDSNVLAEGKAGEYRKERVGGVSGERLLKFFRREDRGDGDIRYKVRDEMRRMITFKQLNLLGPWPMNGPFDLILCRNVIIYFDSPTKLSLVRHFHDYLADDGHLFLGHSESFVGEQHGFATRGRTIFTKTSAQGQGAVR